MKNERIYLSPPNVGDMERESLISSLNSGWVAPVGPSIDEFEVELRKYYRGKPVVALNSGTSALHLALILAGVGDGDHVLVSSFTFVACANVILYERAVPVFLDSEDQTWNLDPEVLSEYLGNLSMTGTLPKAVIVTHLYGMPARIQRMKSICDQYSVCLIEDAAESLGSEIDSLPVGGFGQYGIVSFNGNKIVTTSSGGALICDEKNKKRAIYLATQANSGHHGYNHLEVGFNYRMSNILAGLGVSQLTRLDEFVKKKRCIFNAYKKSLFEDFYFLPEPSNCFSNRWLTVCLINNDKMNVRKLIDFLESNHIESRLLWKPLHMHSAYSSAKFIGSGVCERIYRKGLCLPSGTGLTNEQQDFVILTIRKWIASQ